MTADDEAPLRCPATPRPRGLDGLVLALGIVFLYGLPLFFKLAAEAGSTLAQAIGLPEAIGVGSGVGVVGLLGLVLIVLLYAHQTRYRAAFVDHDGLVLGLLDPPRGVRLRWADLAGFRVRDDGVVLVVRRAPWTRILGPVVRCDGATTHRLVTRLEAHGVPRLDG